MSALRRSIGLVAAAAVAACAHARPVTVAVDTPFALTLGKAARTPDGAGVRYVALLDDSRCPQGVQCVWAGTVRITVQLSGPSRPARTDTLDLARKPRSEAVDGFVVRFVEFEPPPVRSGQPRTEPSKTVATLVVERAER